MVMADEVSLGLSLSCLSSCERSGGLSLELSLSLPTSGKRCRDSSSFSVSSSFFSSFSNSTDGVTQELELAPKRLKLFNDQGHVGPIYCEGEYRKQALRIAAMKVYTGEEEEEEKKVATRLKLYEDPWTIKKVLKASDINVGPIYCEGEYHKQALRIAAMKVYTAEEEEEEKKVATRLKLYEDPWTIKKVLTASDINGSARLLLPAHLVEEHIIKKMDRSQAEKVYTSEGARIRIRDCDTDMSEHELTLKRWISTRSYVLLNNWRRDFEKRRRLKRDDEIALRWDPVKSLLWFRLLKQA